MGLVMTVIECWELEMRRVAYGVRREYFTKSVGRPLQTLCEDWYDLHHPEDMNEIMSTDAQNDGKKALVEAWKKAGVAKGNTAYNKKKYVTVPLTPEDAPVIEALAQDAYQCLVSLNEMVYAGYKVRVTYDRATEAAVVLVDGDHTKANEGLVLESRASDVRLAIAVTVHRVVNKCDFGGWEAEQRGETWFS